MKHPFIKTITAYLAPLALTLCTTPPNNGLLDGQWQITKIQDNATDSIRPKETLYYAFGQNIVNIRWTNRHPEAGNLHYTADTIKIEMPTSSMKTIHQFGMDSTQTNFYVQQLDRKTLVMKGKKSTITCRRF